MKISIGHEEAQEIVLRALKKAMPNKEVTLDGSYSTRFEYNAEDAPIEPDNKKELAGAGDGGKVPVPF